MIKRYRKALLDRISAVLPVFGRVLVVMNSSNNDEYNYDIMTQLILPDSEGRVRFFTSLADAYAEAQTNNNDVILLDANSTHELDTMLTVAKNRVHFFGMDGGGRLTAHGAKIQLSSTGNAAAVAATIKVTGTRCSFRNLKIMNSGTDAASVAAMIDQGEGTLMENVSVMKFTDLNVATVADFICRADSYTYIDCEFGFDTLVQSAARPTFWYMNDGATRAKNGTMVRPLFKCASSEATKVFILVGGTSALAFTHTIRDAVFNNALISSLSAAALTNAVASASGLVEGNILFVDPKPNTTNFCAGVTDQVQVCGPAVSNNALAAVTPA
jgi:hypothetical protein